MEGSVVRVVVVWGSNDTTGPGGPVEGSLAHAIHLISSDVEVLVRQVLCDHAVLTLASRTQEAAYHHAVLFHIHLEDVGAVLVLLLLLMVGICFLCQRGAPTVPRLPLHMFALDWFWSFLYKIGLLQKKASILLVGMCPSFHTENHGNPSQQA